MRRPAVLLSILVLVFLSFSLNAWEMHPSTNDETRSVRWEGQTDFAMLAQVRSDLESARQAKLKKLEVELISPGGPVLSSLEIARLVRNASDKGLVVEFHAVALCASGCTFVLASGTPGHRFINKGTLFLVHSMQEGDEKKLSCVAHVDFPVTQNEKATNVLFDLMRDAYVKYTGQSPAEVENWLTCGDERVGPGQLAVTLHIADATE